MAPSQEPGELSSGVPFSIPGDRSALADRIEDPTLLDRLDAALADEERTPSDVMPVLLDLGAEQFGLEHGVLARLDPALTTHTVTYASGPHPDLRAGTTTDVSATYCRHVIAQNSALGIRRAEEEGDAFGLSTYFGAKVVVDGTLYGTLAFVDRTPRDAAFDEADAAALGLFVQAVRRVLRRRRSTPTQAQVQTLFEEAPSMINVHDRAGNLLIPNPRLCRKTGYEKDELTRMKVWDLDPDVTPDRAREIWANMAPGEWRRWEGRYRRKDGSTFPVEVNLRRLDGEGSDRFVVTSRDITDRKEAERALRQSEELHRETLRNITDAVFITRDDGAFTYVCPNVDYIFKRSPEEVEALGSISALLGSDPAAERSFGDARELTNVEHRVKDADGTWHDLLINVRRVDIQGGTRMYTCRDVTERRKAEEELRATKRLLEKTFESLGEAVLVIDPCERRIVTCNAAVEDVFGYEPDELIGESTEQLHKSPEAYDCFGALSESALEEDGMFRHDYQMRREDGQIIETEHVVTPLEGDDWRQGVVSVVRDVTEQKQAHDALHEREAQLRGLAHSIPGVVFQFFARPDDTWGTHFVSERAESALGISPEPDDFFDRFVERVPSSHREAFVTSIEEAVDREQPWHFELPFQKPSGEQIWLLGTSTPNRRDGEITFNGVLLDVTERKERERTLARRKALLEAQAEATIDGLLVVDENRHVVLHNDRFREIWQLPSDVLPPTPEASPSEREVFDAVTGLLRHPESFWDTVKHLYEHPDEESRDLIRLTDGRWLDRYSAPIVSGDGTHFGRLWVFRDVTDRRRMQERLLEVQEAERRRIDQEIHDEMGGLLTSLQFTLGIARQQFPDDSASTEHVDHIEALVNDLATITRTISRKLYPHELSDYGLAGSLPSLADEMGEQHALTVDLRCGVEPGERFSSLLERTAYWIVQEALLNTARHAETDAAQVTVQSYDDQLRLLIADEGVGFDPSAPHGTKSFGLEGIRRRVERLDGTFALDAHPGEGTRIVVTLPLTMTSGPA